MNSLPRMMARLMAVIAGLLITTACTTPEAPLEQSRIGNIGVVDAIDGSFVLAIDG